MTISKHLGLLFVAAALGGCSSYDAQDRFVLGEATRANLAAQSERPAELPNSKKVESTSGVRAVKAEKALNDGTTKKLASAGGTE